MPLDAVGHLNPGWRCWDETELGNGRYYADRVGYSRLGAASPAELHDQILVAEAITAQMTFTSR